MFCKKIEKMKKIVIVFFFKLIFFYEIKSAYQQWRTHFNSYLRLYKIGCQLTFSEFDFTKTELLKPITAEPLKCLKKGYKKAKREATTYFLFYKKLVKIYISKTKHSYPRFYSSFDFYLKKRELFVCPK